MLTRVRCVAGLTAVAAVIVLIAGITTAAQESASAGLAQQLVAALEEAQLSSIAARDSEGDSEGNRFVGALFFPGRLLVASARFDVTLYVGDKLAARNYMDVYIDVNTASIAESKVLITDGGANGLSANDPTDSTNIGGRLVRFSGDWFAQQLSQTEYTTAFDEAEAGYARMLRALLAEVN